jgi:hypothetical protein
LKAHLQALQGFGARLRARKSEVVLVLNGRKV